MRIVHEEVNTEFFKPLRPASCGLTQISALVLQIICAYPPENKKNNQTATPQLWQLSMSGMA